MPRPLPKVDIFAPGPTPLARTKGPTGQPYERHKSIARNLRHTARHTHRFIRTRRARRALEHLGGLPTAGETYHCVMAGDYRGWDLIPAIIETSHATVDELYITTLGFNRENIVELLAMIDAGTVRRCAFVCSIYFARTKTDGPLTAWFAQAMADRGGHFVATRSHTKIYLLAMATGHRLVVESSANLRSSGNVEQFTITNDADLYRFHASWIDELFE